MTGLMVPSKLPVSLAYLNDMKNMTAKGIRMQADSHFEKGPMDEMPRMLSTNTKA
jgi:hypothetical protein